MACGQLLDCSALLAYGSHFRPMLRAVKTALIAGTLCGISVLSCLLGSGLAQVPTQPPSPGPAESLYLKLRSVGLDKTKVFKIREASLNRGKLHISLDDGTLAFTEGVDGRITGAIFSGYGEALLMPPSQMERTSLAT